MAVAPTSKPDASRGSSSTSVLRRPLALGLVLATIVVMSVVGWRLGWFDSKTSPLPESHGDIPTAPAPAPASSPAESAVALREAIANSDYAAVVEHGKAVGRLGVTQAFLREHGLVAPIIQAAARGDSQLFEALLRVEELRVFGVHREDGLEPIHVAASQGHTSIVELLVTQVNMPVDRPSALTGSTALHEAAAAGQLRMIETLLDLGAGIDVYSTISKRTALHNAVVGGRLDCTAYLLERGADYSAVDNRRQTALHLAASAGDYDAVKLIREYGASVDVRDQNMKRPVDLAREGAFDETEELLLRGAGS